MGAVKGVGLGVQHMVMRPIKGVGLAGYRFWQLWARTPEDGPTYSTCFTPVTH